MVSEQNYQASSNANIGEDKREEVYETSLLSKIVLLLVVILPLAATILAIVQLWNRWVVWLDVVVMIVSFVVTILGVAIGFHRMLTHRSFDAPEPVRFFFLALGSMAFQGRPTEWAATHSKHHAKSDKPGDPHSPLDGFWHAHFGWLFRNQFVRGGKWMKSYENDRVAKFLDKNTSFLTLSALSVVLPGVFVYALGGSFLQGVLWGGAVRLFLVHQVTWSVNSVCHTFGWQSYKTSDRSKNEPFVGALGLGEGWHNNHHAFPWSAYHGLHWWQIDVSGYLIRLMKWMGLVQNVLEPTKEQMEARKL